MLSRLVSLTILGLIAGSAAVLLGPVAGARDAADPCRTPMAWHVRTVDPRFGFTAEEVRAAVKEAASVWEEAGDRSLFRHEAGAGMAVDLVYDDRQAHYERRRAQEQELAALAAEVEELKPLLERRRMRAEEDRRRHEAERTRASADAYRASVDRYNVMVERHNRVVERYDRAWAAADAIGPGAVRAGDLRSETRTLVGLVVDRTRVLTIAVAGDYDELVTVLAHELGHALGIRHLDAPGALMAERYQQSDVARPIRLGEADRAALAAVCGDRR